MSIFLSTRTSSYTWVILNWSINASFDYKDLSAILSNTYVYITQLIQRWGRLSLGGKSPAEFSWQLIHYWAMWSTIALYRYLGTICSCGCSLCVCWENYPLNKHTLILMQQTDMYENSMGSKLERTPIHLLLLHPVSIAFPYFPINTMTMWVTTSTFD